MNGFCTCPMFVPKDDDEDICGCGHDYIDHLHQTIGDCTAKLDPAEMGLFP